MSDKKANHQAVIVRIGEPRPHLTADTLELIDIPNTGYQVVSKKEQFKTGDLAVYVCPDSVVPEIPAFAFLWTGIDSPVPERKRRVTVRRFRGQYSEGLLMPVTDFSGGLSHDGEIYGWLREGDDVSDLLGITHWSPPEPGEMSTKGVGNRQQPKFPRSLKGLWYWLLTRLGFLPNGVTGGLDEKAPPTVPPVYDVESLKHFVNVLKPGEIVTVTEKIHGSNARFTFQNGKLYAGSRQLWKRPETSCIWRTAVAQLPWITEFCQAHEGYTLYGEIVPTQGEKYMYGCKPGEVKVFIFDILDDKGNWLPKIETLMMPGITTVPCPCHAEYTDELLKLADGTSMVVGATNAREGIVITADNQRYVRGLGRVQLKVVSNSWLEKDGK